MIARYLIATLVTIMSISLALAEEKKPDPHPTDDKYAWHPLFDGKSLKGWKISDYAGHGEVEVKNGEIHIKWGDGLSGITWDGEAPHKVNYELEVEAKKLGGNDIFCAITFPVKDSHASFVCGGWGGGVTGISSIDGHDASDNETTKAMNFEKNKWYTLRVRVTDDKIQCWINDQQEVDLELADKQVNTRIDIDRSRPLGLATWQTMSAMRNIRIRPLKPDEIKK